MSRVLVTGGAGFIGSHLCDRLVEDGHNVVAVDDLSLGRRENLQRLQGNEHFRLYETDVLEAQQFDEIIQREQPETIFHLAANSDVARGSLAPEVDLNKTFLTSFQVLETMRRHSVRNIVFASTAAIYGQARVEKIPEDYGPLFPISHYGAGKLASEAFIASYVANYNLRAWIFRFPNVVGERATHGVLYDFMRKLRGNRRELEVLGDGEQTKPYIYVKDLVDAILYVRNNTEGPLEYVHVGSETRTKVRDIARMVTQAMGISPHIHFAGGQGGWVGDQPEYTYSLDKLHRLGWKVPRTSDEAVELAIERMLAYETESTYSGRG